MDPAVSQPAPLKGATTFRRLIAPQATAARRSWGPTVECARCGLTIAAGDAHADHYPVPLAAIIRAYLDLCTLRRREITVDAWKAFHAEQATFAPSCAACNLAHNPRGATWAERRGRRR